MRKIIFILAVSVVVIGLSSDTNAGIGIGIGIPQETQGRVGAPAVPVFLLIDTGSVLLIDVGSKFKIQ